MPKPEDSAKILELEAELLRFKKLEQEMKKEKLKYAEMIKQVEKMAKD